MFEALNQTLINTLGPAGPLLALGGVGIVLIVLGVLVIGMVDNILRPILVGKDTRMPDYVILVATLGGMAIFGLNGFVIGPLVAAMFMAVLLITLIGSILYGIVMLLEKLTVPRDARVG